MGGHFAPADLAVFSSDAGGGSLLVGDSDGLQGIPVLLPTSVVPVTHSTSDGLARARLVVLDDGAARSRVLEPAGQRVPVRGPMPIVLRAHFVSDNFQATRSAVYLDGACSRPGARGRPEHEVRVSVRVPAFVVH